MAPIEVIPSPTTPTFPVNTAVNNTGNNTGNVNVNRTAAVNQGPSVNKRPTAFPGMQANANKGPSVYKPGVGFGSMMANSPLASGSWAALQTERANSIKDKAIAYRQVKDNLDAPIAPQEARAYQVAFTTTAVNDDAGAQGNASHTITTEVIAADKKPADTPTAIDVADVADVEAPVDAEGEVKKPVIVEPPSPDAADSLFEPEVKEDEPEQPKVVVKLSPPQAKVNLPAKENYPQEPKPVKRWNSSGAAIVDNPMWESRFRALFDRFKALGNAMQQLERKERSAPPHTVSVSIEEVDAILAEGRKFYVHLTQLVLAAPTKADATADTKSDDGKVFDAPTTGSKPNVTLPKDDVSTADDNDETASNASDRIRKMPAAAPTTASKPVLDQSMEQMRINMQAFMSTHSYGKPTIAPRKAPAAAAPKKKSSWAKPPKGPSYSRI